MIPDAIVNRRQKKKEKTFEYEACWRFGRFFIFHDFYLFSWEWNGKIIPTDVYSNLFQRGELNHQEVKWQFKSMDSNTWVEKDRHLFVVKIRG